MIPKEVFFTKGMGIHREKLQSFEMALRQAGIAKCNLVNVSSILPPGCRIASRDKGIAKLRAGQITFAVIARNATNEPNRMVASSIGLAVPADRSSYGYLSEHTPSARTTRSPATTPKTWPRPCSPPPWASPLTRTWPGSSASRSIG